MMHSIENLVEDKSVGTLALMSRINSLSHFELWVFLHLPSGSCDLQYVLLIMYICCLFQLQSGHGGEKGRSELA